MIRALIILVSISLTWTSPSEAKAESANAELAFADICEHDAPAANNACVVSSFVSEQSLLDDEEDEDPDDKRPCLAGGLILPATPLTGLSCSSSVQDRPFVFGCFRPPI